jgi:hypothetical protein
MMKDRKSSRLSGFYNRSLDERLQVVGEWAGLSATDLAVVRAGLGAEQADLMIENALGTFALPLGVGVNFLVNGRDYLVPMAVEEPSVVAAVSNAARLARTADGFSAGSTEPVMIGQVQLMEVPDLATAGLAVLAAEAQLASLIDPLHPAVLRQIARVIEAAHAAGKWVGLCGELAGKPEGIPVLLGLGLDEFSMSASSVPGAKALLARLSVPEAQKLAQRVLNPPDTAAVKAAVKTCVETL